MMTTNSFQAVLRSHGYSECDGMIVAYEYEEGKWIFIAEEDSAIYTVNLFSGDFHGEPLYHSENEHAARIYTEGWVAGHIAGAGKLVDAC